MCARTQSDVTQPSARPQVDMAEPMGIDVASGALLGRWEDEGTQPVSN